MPQDRQERHLMRQRGAGTRRLDNASFGFTFGTAAKQKSPSTSTPAVAAVTKAQTPSQLPSSRKSISHSTRRNRSSKKPLPTPASIPTSVKESNDQSSLVASQAVSRTSRSNDKKNDKAKSGSATRAVRAGTRKSKSKGKSGSRSLKTPVPMGSPSVSAVAIAATAATAAPLVASVTGKRKRGKGPPSKKAIATVHEDEDDELGQENIDMRFSPASSLTVRKYNASIAKRTGLKDVKSLTTQPSNGHQRRAAAVDNDDDGADELASPRQLEKRVRKTDGGVAARKMMSRNRVPPVMRENGDDDDGGDEISSATNSVVAALLSRKSEGKTDERTLGESRRDKRRVPVKKGHDNEEKPSSRGASKEFRKLPDEAETEAEKHVEDAESNKTKTSVESTLSNGQQRAGRGRPKGRVKSKVKATGKDGAEPKNAHQTTTRTKGQKMEPRDAEVLDEDKMTLPEEEPEPSLVPPPNKPPKSKQSSAKTKDNNKKKPLVSEPSVPEIATQTPPDDDEQLLHLNSHTEESPQESAETEKQLTKDGKEPSTGLLTAQQPASNIDNDQKSVSTTNSATSSFSTATTASTKPSTIDSRSVVSNPKCEGVETTDINARSEPNTNSGTFSNLPDNGGENNNVDIRNHQADLSDHQSYPTDNIYVNENLPKRARSKTSELKHPRQKALDAQREKEAIKARIEEAKREERHMNESPETSERKKLTKMMEDLRHVVRRGRARAQEIGWCGEMSLVSSANGAHQGILSGK